MNNLTGTTISNTSDFDFNYDMITDSDMTTTNGNIILSEKCECGGIFEFENRILTSFPPQYPYRCNKCGKRVVRRTDNTVYEW